MTCAGDPNDEPCNASESLSDCGLVWEDGWGEHLCHLRKGHDGDHRCNCDAFVSPWMAEWMDENDEFVLESAEEARLRLRDELRKLQELE